METGDAVDEIGRRVVRLVEGDGTAKDHLAGRIAVQPDLLAFQDGLDLAAGQRVVHLLEVRQDERALVPVEESADGVLAVLRVGVRGIRAHAPAPRLHAAVPIHGGVDALSVQVVALVEAEEEFLPAALLLFVGIADAGDLQPLVGRAGVGDALPVGVGLRDEPGEVCGEAEHAVPELHLGPAHDQQLVRKVVVLLVGGDVRVLLDPVLAFGRDVREGHGLEQPVDAVRLRRHDHGHGGVFGKARGKDAARHEPELREHGIDQLQPFRFPRGFVDAADDVRAVHQRHVRIVVPGCHVRFGGKAPALDAGQFSGDRVQRVVGAFDVGCGAFRVFQHQLGNGAVLERSRAFGVEAHGLAADARFVDGGIEDVAHHQRRAPVEREVAVRKLLQAVFVEVLLVPPHFRDELVIRIIHAQPVHVAGLVRSKAVNRRRADREDHIAVHGTGREDARGQFAGVNAVSECHTLLLGLPSLAASLVDGFEKPLHTAAFLAELATGFGKLLHRHEQLFQIRVGLNDGGKLRKRFATQDGAGPQGKAERPVRADIHGQHLLPAGNQLRGRAFGSRRRFAGCFWGFLLTHRCVPSKCRPTGWTG